jgi:hypothetical protein
MIAESEDEINEKTLLVRDRDYDKFGESEYTTAKPFLLPNYIFSVEDTQTGKIYINNEAGSEIVQKGYQELEQLKKQEENLKKDKEAQKAIQTQIAKEKLQPETAPKTSNAEQVTTALALPTTKEIQSIAKGAFQQIRCTTCGKLFGSEAEFSNAKMHSCVRVVLRCPVCGSEDVE